MLKSKSKQNGFTIVELLIVIVVIGILAALVIVSYNGINNRANQAKISSDINTLTKAVFAARNNASSNLNVVTGNNATGGGCWGKPTGTDLAALQSSDSCISAYNSALNAISNASDINVRSLRDPWGRPYLIDENEGENGGCGRDTIAAYKYPFTTAFGSYSTTPVGNIPLAGFSGC